MAVELDRCDLIDVLEEAVVARHPVEVELADGTTFVEEVRDVVTEEGEDYAVFRGRARVPVSEIRGCSSAR